MYGSDAVAGVVNLFPPVPGSLDRRLKVRYLSEYQSNNGLIGNALRLSYSGSHWLWAFRGSERIARNYNNPIDRRVYNTGFRTINASALVGYRSEKGYTHLNLTLYDNLQGIPDGSRDSLTRKFTFQVYETEGENTLQPAHDNIKDRPVVPARVLDSYDLSPLHQRIQDYRLYVDNAYQIGAGDLKVLLGIERNARREYDHPTAPQRAGLYVQLTTLNYGLRYNAPSFLGIEVSIGANGMYQSNRNLAATDFPIPDYRLFDFGTYGYTKWKQGRWSIAGGIRYDHRTENGKEMYTKPDPFTGFYGQVPLSDSAGGVHQFPAFSLAFKGLSGSLGMTWQFSDHLSFKA
jgi:iron complex outermembrane receptor protein